MRAVCVHPPFARAVSTARFPVCRNGGMPRRHLATTCAVLALSASQATAAPPSVLTLAAPTGATVQASLPLTTTSFLVVVQQQQGGPPPTACDPAPGSDGVVLLEDVGG